MFTQNAKQNLYPHVEDLYRGKSVLITGAVGFVGMVILEILLRNVPDIKTVYILVREKKGLTPEQRKEKLFQKDIFKQLKEDQPDALLKAHLIKGDVMLSNLGMDEEDMQEVIRNVSIVFHCAAIINHSKALKEVLATNAVGTQYVVELCKRLEKLEVLVYTSTICSNCNRDKEIQEEIYRLPFHPNKFLNEVKYGTDESLQRLASQCHPYWPNSYTFSKCLAENILQENASEVPFAIIRPSLVFTIWKAPLPGYAEKNSALALLCTGVAKGFIKVLRADPKLVVDFVPADVVANAHIVAAWKVASGRCASPLVVNCTSYGVLKYNFAEYGSIMFSMIEKNLLPNCFRTPTLCKMIKSIPMYKVMTFYEHYVPAYCIDLILKLSGKKPKLVSLYQLFDKANMSTSFFTTTDWTYATKNFHSLEEHMDQQDKEKFYTDISDLKLEKVVNDVPNGYSGFDWTKDKRTKTERLTIAKKYVLWREIYGPDFSPYDVETYGADNISESAGWTETCTKEDAKMVYDKMIEN